MQQSINFVFLATLDAWRTEEDTSIIILGAIRDWITYFKSANRIQPHNKTVTLFSSLQNQFLLPGDSPDREFCLRYDVGWLLKWFSSARGPLTKKLHQDEPNPVFRIEIENYSRFKW